MKKKVLTVLALVPLVLGTIGYIFSGERITNAIYAAFALYFTNPISDAYNVYIEIARWTAPLVTATAILCALQNVWESLRNRVVLFGKKNSVSVYSDMDCRIRFGKDVGAITQKGACRKKGIYWCKRYRVLLFESFGRCDHF